MTIDHLLYEYIQNLKAAVAEGCPVRIVNDMRDVSERADRLANSTDGEFTNMIR